MITQKFNIYLHAGIAFAPVVHCSQYSQGETWTFTILDNDGSVYRPSSGALIGVKADGNVIAGITGTVNSDGSVSIVTTQQLTAAAGRGLFELTIDGGTNGTANFIVEVEPKPTDGGVLSESDLSIIQQGINSVTPAVITETVSDYLAEHMTNPPIDPTLTVSNAAADAKVTGDEITDLKNAINSFGQEHFNLYSGVNNTLERYVNQDTGNLTFNASFQTSDYIDISAYAGSTINVSYTFSGAFYDSDKTYISGIGRSDANYTDLTLNVPVNAVYARISVSNANTSLLQIGKNVSRYYYKPYADYRLNNLDVDFEQIDGISDLVTSGNLFDKSTAFVNKYISGTTGNLNTLNGYNASDFIDIGNGEYVTAVNCFNMVVYKSDKTYSREVTRRYDNYPLTAKLSSDEKYVRISVKNATLNSAKVEKNFGVSSYVPYGNAFSAEHAQSETYKETKVYIGQGCYFESINSALTAITDNSIKNRYTLFITEGTYNETITTKDYVNLEGESKYKSIINYISDDESDYVNRSAVFATSYSTIKNLTIRTTGSKYPLHIDARYNEEYDLKVVNCLLQHDGFAGSAQPAGTAVGIGLYWGQHVTLDTCECVGSGITGVASVYCHNSSENDASHSRFRSLTIKNCILSNATYGLRLQAIENNQLQANECVYVGNKNTCEVPVRVEMNTYQSWHVFSVGNEPPYTQE